MKSTTDLSVINWLKPTLNTLRSGPILKVCDMLPNIFAAYTALLPVVGIIEDFPFNEINLQDSSIAQLNENATIWEQYGTHSIHHAPNYALTKFKDLADRFAIPYDLSMGRRLDWRKKGFATLTQPTISGLTVLLKALAADNQLLLYVEDYWRWEVANQLFSTADEVVYHVTQKNSWLLWSGPVSMLRCICFHRI